MNKKIVGSAAAYALSNITVQVFNFISTLLLMRLLSLEIFGSVGVLTEIFALFMVIGESGVRNFIINKLREKSEPFSNIKFSFQFQLYNAITLAVIFYIIFIFVLKDVNYLDLLITLFFSAVYILTVPAQATFLFKGKKNEMILKDMLTAGLRLLFILITFYLNLKVNIHEVMMLWLIPVAISSIYLNRIWRTAEGSIGVLPSRVSSSTYIENAVLLIPFLSISIVNGIYNRVGVFVLQYFGSVSEAGLYIGAAKFVLPCVFILFAFSNSLTQTFSSDKLPLFNWKFALLCISPAFFIYICLNFIVPIIFTNFFFGKYDGSISILRILSLYVLIVFSYGLFSSYLIVNGHQKKILKVNICSLIMIVFSSLYLVPRFSALGLAYAFISVEICIALFYFITIAKMGLKPTLFFIFPSLYALVYCAISIYPS